MNADSERTSLEDAGKVLQTTIDKYQVMVKLAKLYVHYRDVNMIEMRLQEAACFVSLACIKRLLGEGTPTHPPGKQQAYFAEVEHHLNYAKAAYSDLTSHHPVECKRGLANILKELGALRFFQEKYDEAESLWSEACLNYEQVGDGPAVADMRKRMDKVQLVHDIAAYKKTLLERTGDNHERDALWKAFLKFDRDNSGEMDASEFAALSLELGTALTPDEIKEAFTQLDSSADNKISFGEFWSWWCTDEIQAFANKPRKAR
ncbi:hypothetical protein LEN26_003783 [Aphanomyces euteiches]|nr:hypothetical protein LEN26_003783 [Aphanomyces euteiches]KAH9195990.1 hypothetical protein AeNC1_002030 [Aphanomyces euteiches]